MDVSANKEAVMAAVAAACARAGREADTVRVLAVTKGHSPETVRAAWEAGFAWFGESKVQEAKVKIPRCPSAARWHMIGHLQTNKAREAVRLFDMIESVDSLRAAEEINKAAVGASKAMPVLLEVNVAGESSKFGYTPERLLEELEALNALDRLEIHGLMTMAPWSPDAEKARPVFRRLRELKGRCEAILEAPLPELSMGMSGDFEVAIEEGSTLIRIGTALFGPRTWSPRDLPAD